MKIFLLLLLLSLAATAVSGCASFGSIHERQPREEYTRERISPIALSPQSNTILSPVQIFEYSADAVFTIYTSFDNEDFHSSGSGFFICPTGIAVTNHHVIVDWFYAYIRANNGQEFTVIGYYYYDFYNDLALIRVEGDNFSYLQMGNPDALRVGESIYTIGTPFGYHNTFSTGIVSGFNNINEFGEYRVYDMIQFTAPISDGSSGGALINNYGQVVGVTTSTYCTSFGAQAINFAVPISRVNLTIIDELKPLPVGNASAVQIPELVGLWVWSNGTYNFYLDGNGSRVWDNVSNTFRWSVVGSWLLLNLTNGENERWSLEIISDNVVYIGQAHFSRNANIALEGAWTFELGTYIFYENETGRRILDGEERTFCWNINFGFLHLRFVGNYDNEIWGLDVLDDGVIYIGGERFLRSE